MHAQTLARMRTYARKMQAHTHTFGWRCVKVMMEICVVRDFVIVCVVCLCLLHVMFVLACVPKSAMH